MSDHYKLNQSFYLVLYVLLNVSDPKSSVTDFVIFYQVAEASSKFKGPPPVSPV